MNNAPDVVGFQLEEAKKILENAGFEIVKKKTQSPKTEDCSGECRIVRQRSIDHYIELLVSYF